MESELLNRLYESLLTILSYDPSRPLLFNSPLFLVLFTPFIIGYGVVKRWVNLRIIYVIAFSLLFYYKSSGEYFLILIFASAWDFTLAHYIHASKKSSLRRLFLTLSVAMNIGMLVYFKYTNLFVEITSTLLNSDDLLNFGNIFLPVGISFFVFQSLSYTIDVYRRKLRPLDRWLDYLFYLSFFPQLVAGPIVRAGDFIPQIRRPINVTREMFGTAIFLLLTGLIKKAIISDYISIHFVDGVFSTPHLYSGVETLVGVWGYAIQIYCDFSGYSDMAIALALLLGFKLPPNFDSPYRSATISEFWRRWHMSLSLWLRDYLYISLGGNRKGQWRTYINITITMLLGGLWHGAALRFVLWGLLHGIALAAHKLWLRFIPWAQVEGSQMNPLLRAISVVITFNFVCTGWLLFRADSLKDVKSMLHQIIYNFDYAVLPELIKAHSLAIAMIVAGLALHFTPTSIYIRVREGVASSPLWLQITLLVLVIWCAAQLSSANVQPFIYFQF